MEQHASDEWGYGHGPLLSVTALPKCFISNEYKDNSSAATATAVFEQLSLFCASSLAHQFSNIHCRRRIRFVSIY